MAKQFLANRSGQTPTLDEVPNETIKIYPTEADLDADLANLEENEIVATEEDNNPASGTQYPVDVVQNGNMNAVTSNAVAEYAYSKYNTSDNFQKSFIRIGAIGIYTKIIELSAGTDKGVEEDLGSLFIKILSVQLTGASWGGRYPNAYWQNNNNATLTVVYTVANTSRLCIQVMGVLKENYVEPF